MRKNIIRLTETQLHSVIRESIKKTFVSCLFENFGNDAEEKVMAEVHCYDAKGRRYRLEQLADELKKMNIEVNGVGFDGDYDGYVDIKVNREQAKMLDTSKYRRRFNIVAGGEGTTIDEQFDNAIAIDRMLAMRYGKK